MSAPTTLTEKCRGGKHFAFSMLSSAELKLVVACLSLSMDRTIGQKFPLENADVIRQWAFATISSSSKFVPMTDAADTIDKGGLFLQADEKNELSKVITSIGTMFDRMGGERSVETHETKENRIQGYLDVMKMDGYHGGNCWCCGVTEESSHLFTQLRVDDGVIISDFIETEIENYHDSLRNESEIDFGDPQKIDKNVSLSDIIKLYPNLISMIGDTFGYDVLIKSLQ